jgi:hypothetical protein
MLVEYVSNERYVALCDVLFEFRGQGRVVTARSGISCAGGADMIIHEPPNGGAVFSIGSIC